MTHAELSGMYELYALGVLTPDEREEIDEHLSRGCEECRAGMRRAQELNAMFAALPEQVTPPKRLRSRVLASVGGRPLQSRATAMWAGAAACFCIAFMIAQLQATSNGESRRQLRARTEELAQARREFLAAQTQLSGLQGVLDFLEQPETRETTFGGGAPQPPRGRILVNPSRGVLFIASHLPTVPAGKAFEMWVIPKAGAPAPAGVFEADTAGRAIHLEAGPVDRTRIKAIAVTVEPRAGSAAPTSIPFIIATL